MRIRDLLYLAVIVAFATFLSVNFASAQPEWPRHLVQGSFTPESSVSFDSDGDGLDEVFCLEASDGSIRRFSWSAGIWTQDTIFEPQAAGGDLAADDIDQDGDQDLIVFDYILGLYWLEHDDSSWIQHEIAEFPDRLVTIHTGDLDHDGDPDVLSCMRFQSQISWWENDPDGWTEHLIVTSYDWIDDATTADMDNDGDADVVVAHVTGTAWLEKDDDGWIEHDTGLTFGERPLTTGDFNGDGLMDIIAGGPTYKLYLNLQTGTDWTTVLLNNWTIDLRSLEVEDLDFDGDLDLYAGYEGNEAQLTYYLNDGEGSFNVWPVSYDLNDLNTVSASDINGDGFLDFAMASELDGVKCFLSEDLFTWIREDVQPGYAGSIRIAVADFRGDGQLDFVADFGFRELRCWHDNGQDWVYNTVVDGEYRSLAAIDINQDGKFELVSAEFGLYELNCWDYADGSWNWLFPIDTDQVWIDAIEVADLDQDGDSDILTGSYEGLVWCENQYGFFSPHWILNQNMTHILAIAAADMDNDGRLDPITLRNNGELNIWFNVENTWYWQVVGLTDGGSRAILPVNLDADPELEIITATYSQLLRWDKQPNQSWESSEAFAGIESAMDLDAADIDGDEWTDILITHSDRLVWAEQTQSGGWITRIVYEASFSCLEESELIDMDQDGDIDIASVGQLNDLFWLENTGNLFVAHEPAATLPQTTVLYPNHPNPFNPTTQLTFALPRPGHTSLVVYDATGREVVRLVDGELSAGTHRAMFDGTGLASGVYFATLTGPDQQVQSQKLVLVK
ncbi:T9SS type A sorting domain-containing protein [bacterium]|nr:T9SS type A sorting domain-containing protein [bacterium]